MRRLWAVLLVLACAPTLLAQSHAQPSESSRALEALAVPIYQQLAALKGMSAPGNPPPVLLRSREDNRRFMEQEMNRRYSPARIEAERKTLVAWGLIPADYDLRTLFLDLMQEQISAYYDPRAKVMVVGDWLPPEQQRAALIHELVHALQDREIALEGFISPDPGRGDQLLARQALIEGEAVALTIDFLLKAQNMDITMLPDLSNTQGLIATSAGGPMIAKAPKFLRDLLLFPYLEGVGFAYQLRKTHPWSAMSALYRDPPRSTAQIMDPAKRIGSLREDPVAVNLPDLAGLLPGGTLVSEDEVGEFGLGAVIALHLGEIEGRRAAVGWRGDRFQVWEDAGGHFLIACLVVMRDEQMAATLAGHLRDFVARRHPGLAAKMRAGGGGATTWSEGGRASLVDRRGSKVLLLEQVPAATVERVRDTIWRSRTAGPRR
ncbi:MAG TPA: ImmA/IrrE family metallo-endopeptidase [Methylomirabilota bacterium]|jgi:hypothetical protein|nr:ImmA/IrrE family metallo-endopeptidase [Methylomirabilota bacterium]